MKVKLIYYKYACFSCRKCFAREAHWLPGKTQCERQADRVQNIVPAAYDNLPALWGSDVLHGQEIQAAAPPEREGLAQVGICREALVHLVAHTRSHLSRAA
jgi:hypothetical protein